jgi:hypothetical protein
MAPNRSPMPNAVLRFNLDCHFFPLPAFPHLLRTPAPTSLLIASVRSLTHWPIAPSLSSRPQADAYQPSAKSGFGKSAQIGLNLPIPRSSGTLSCRQSFKDSITPVLQTTHPTDHKHARCTDSRQYICGTNESSESSIVVSSRAPSLPAIPSLRRGSSYRVR